MTGIQYLTSVLMMMMLCIVRLAAALSLMPVFAKQYIMGMGRNVIIFAMALPLFHVVYPEFPSTQIPFLILFVTICKEVIIGALLGYLSGFIFYAADSVGFIVDIQRGSSMAMTFDPVAGSQTSLIGSFLTQMTTTLFFTMGGFLFFIGVVYQTYVIWPVFSFFPTIPPKNMFVVVSWTLSPSKLTLTLFAHCEIMPVLAFSPAIPPKQ